MKVSAKENSFGKFDAGRKRISSKKKKEVILQNGKFIKLGIHTVNEVDPKKDSDVQPL